MPEHQQMQQSKKPAPSYQRRKNPANRTHESNPAAIIQRARINPKSLSRADVLQLQRSIGNRAVGRLLSGSGKLPSTIQQPPVQRKEPEEEEEPLQGKMVEAVQRQEIPEEEELQMKTVVQRQEIPEEEETLQGKMIETIQCQEIQEEEEPLQMKRENDTGMPDNLKAGVESISGTDMSGVQVHYNSSMPDRIGALAYTQGKDIHVAPGQERHLPHEAWHVVQQAQGRVKPTMQLKGVKVNDDVDLEREADVMGERAVQVKHSAPATSRAGENVKILGSSLKIPLQRLNSGARPPTGVVQRAFQPAETTANAHLRNDGAWGAYVGNRIDSGSEVIIDRAQQKTQARFIRSNVTWTKAVNVTAANWTWNQRNATTYIRDSSVAPKAYPVRARDVVVPTRPNLRPERQWNEQAGEYVMLENSAAVPGAKLVKKGPLDKRLTASNQYENLNSREERQLDLPRLKAVLQAHLKIILETSAMGKGLKTGLLETDYNTGKLMHPLRYDEAKDMIDDNFINWYNWTEGVFDRIEEGADYAAESIEHWRKWLHPSRKDEVSIDKIELTGSDLHDEGLGAIFVTFSKPTGPSGHKFENQTNFKVLIKSEDKALENALFGTENTSLANRVNAMTGLKPEEAITTFKMETSANYGSIIEFVRGARADSFDHPQPCTSAMKEAMVFAFIAGLSDLHHENVLWENGKPYFIDADNALNKDRLGLTMKPQARNQTGFTEYNRDAAIGQLDIIDKKPQDSESKIMKALLADSDKKPIIKAVQTAFTGKTGRVVPISTGSWAGVLKRVYIFMPEGTAGDDDYKSRWGIASKQASRVPKGTPDTPEPGLEGEAGIAQSGRFFDRAKELTQIKADFDKGKIPFYNYEYDTGHITHNGQDIWHGQTLAEALEILLKKFPKQRGVT